MDKPQIFLEGAYEKADIDSFVQQKNPKIYDIYSLQQSELSEISSPSRPSTAETAGDDSEKGSWIYYPWSNYLLHAVGPEDLLKLRTNRNQHLISSDEQAALQEFSVGILGLSVGNSMALSLMHTAACGQLVLADRDEFSTSNMNRVRINLADVGQPKLEVTAHQIYEMNPYADIVALDTGLSAETMDIFFNRSKFIVFDEIDDFEMKVLVRQEAKRRKIPVVMLTNLGDNVLIDVERYDTQPDTEIFNGLIEGVVQNILEGNIGEAEKKRFAAQIVGIQNVPTRALQSLKDIGTTLAGRPQLYSAVSLSAGLATYIVRRIALGQTLGSGRYFLSLADILHLDRDDLDITPERQSILEILSKGPQ